MIKINFQVKLNEIERTIPLIYCFNAVAMSTEGENDLPGWRGTYSGLWYSRASSAVFGAWTWSSNKDIQLCGASHSRLSRSLLCQRTYRNKLALRPWFRDNRNRPLLRTAGILKTFMVKGSKVKVTACRNPSAVETLSVKFSQLKLGEDYPNAKRTVLHQGHWSNRRKLEIWHIFDLSSKTSKNLVWSPNYCCLLENWSRWI